MSAAAASRSTRIAIVAAITIAAAAYPFLLVVGLGHASARAIGTALLVLALALGLAAGGKSRVITLMLRRFGLLVVVAGAATATNHAVALKLLPSLSSLWLLATFAASLRREPSIVGQFATAMHSGFPDFLLPYCRSVTIVWCVFFAANAIAGALLAVAAPPRVWAFYSGVLSYLLVALLASAEYVFHKVRFRFYEDGWADRIWRRFCPPERTALGRRTLAWQLSQQPVREPAR